MHYLVIQENADGSALVVNAIVIADGLTPLKRESVPIVGAGPGWTKDEAGQWAPPAHPANVWLVRSTQGGGAVIVDGVEVAGELVPRSGDMAAFGPGWTRDAAGVWTAPAIAEAEALDNAEG